MFSGSKFAYLVFHSDYKHSYSKKSRVETPAMCIPSYRDLFVVSVLQQADLLIHTLDHGNSCSFVVPDDTNCCSI